LTFFACFNVYCAEDENLSLYKNDEEHIAKKVDANNVPIDPACKLKLVWDNVKIHGNIRTAVPKNAIKKLTIVKFNFAGAWIAWTDDRGYHELTDNNYIPWRNFPEEIRSYYAKHCLPEWKIQKIKTPFSLRSPQFTRSGKELSRKKGSTVRRRTSIGLLCPEITRNVFVPFSEFPLEVRTQCGYYENESYIPEVPLMTRGAVSLDDPVLFLPANSLAFKQRFRDGSRMARITLKKEGKTVFKDIVIEPFKGSARANHNSDLHVFKESKVEKKCIKCEKTLAKYEKMFYNKL
jgi:hypothetical protein